MFHVGAILRDSEYVLPTKVKPKYLIVLSVEGDQVVFFGLTTSQQYCPDKVVKHGQDVVIAKNYLSEKELNGLNRIVTAYLDYAEMQAENYVVLTMKDWIDKLNAFLQFNEKEILENAGKVSATIAQEFALNEYEKYNQTVLQNYESDFDKLLRIGMNL